MRECISPSYQGTGFYSTYFLVPKKNGRWRPILDLSRFNCFIQQPKFHMVALAANILSLEKGTCFSALDMQDP